MNLCFIAVAHNCEKKPYARTCTHNGKDIRKYIDDLMVRGKYTFYINDLSKSKNCPDRRRDYRKPVSVTKEIKTINLKLSEMIAHLPDSHIASLTDLHMSYIFKILHSRIRSVWT